jgi:hypothetical protein
MLQTSWKTIGKQATALKQTRCFSQNSMMLMRMKGKDRIFDKISTGHPTMDEIVTNLHQDFNKPYRADAPSPYQAMMVTEAVLIRSYLEKVQNELPLLNEKMQPAPFSPPTMKQYLRFRTVDFPTDPSHPMSTKALLTVKLTDVAQAESLTKDDVHALILLSGPRYDPVKDTISMNSTRFPYRAQNKRYLEDTFATLLKEAKINAQKYSSAPVDLRHAQKKLRAINVRKKLKLPQSWLDESNREKRLISNEESPQS